MLAFGFGLPGTTHQCPGKQWENSKEHVGALFFFLVLTTSGKNLDENRGAAGMIEEGFFCVVFFFLRQDLPEKPPTCSDKASIVVDGGEQLSACVPLQEPQFLGYF